MISYVVHIISISCDECLFDLKPMEVQMSRNLLSFRVNENWIEIESSGRLKKEITIKHNGEEIRTQKSWGIDPIILEVEEGGETVRYQIVISQGSRSTYPYYSVTRNNEPVLKIG